MEAHWNGFIDTGRPRIIVGGPYHNGFNRGFWFAEAGKALGYKKNIRF